MSEWIKRWLPHLQFALDSMAWMIALPFASWARYDLERFVNISTDQAANPISVLGTTRRPVTTPAVLRAAAGLGGGATLPPSVTMTDDANP